MIYSIWSDISFYFYLLLAITSAIVIVLSIRRLIDEMGDWEKDKKSQELINLNDIEQENINQDYDRQIKETELKEFTTNQQIREEKEEKIVFEKDAETIFNSTALQYSSDVYSKKQDEDKALVFLKNLNENISKINDVVLKIDEIERKLNEIEGRIENFENSIKEFIKGEIAKTLTTFDMKNNLKDVEAVSNNITPKYVSKYLEDIVEEFDSLDREIIKKRIKVISEDLKKISGG